jgi:proteasome lid subunit RPN8/RPN11
MLNIFKKKKIEKIEINSHLIQKICDLSKDCYPKEFLAFLEGEIDNNRIHIKDIIFQPYIGTKDSAMAHIDFPLTVKSLGSVHSHPTKSNKPSSADLKFFHKTGIIHAIIKYPYKREDVQFYDINGQEINVEETNNNE